MNTHRLTHWTAILVLAVCGGRAVSAADNATCLGCHEDAGLKSQDGRGVGVSPDFAKSVHGGLSCTDCHGEGNYEDTPHFKAYPPVNCDSCHEGVMETWRRSVHGKTTGGSAAQPAACADCHGGGDPHRIQPLKSGAAVASCERCHQAEWKKFRASPHAAKFPGLGKNNGCATCHPPHGETKLAGDPVGITRTCQECHADALVKLKNGPHGIHGIHVLHPDPRAATVSCASCHDSHGAPDPIQSADAFTNCLNCHKKSKDEFIGSVHETRLAAKEMTCASCHSIHLKKGESAFHCGSCHPQQGEEYRKSAHFREDPSGLGVAANCGACHDGGHGVKRVKSRESMANLANQPKMCGKCHGDNLVITANYVRLPMTLSNYRKSIHARKFDEWVKDPSKPRGAVCSDCHGFHMVQSAGDIGSVTNRHRLPLACGKCHPKPAAEYVTSVHGAALEHGIMDAPTCNDCHESHLILPRTDPLSQTYPTNVAADCGRCHENRALTDRFGIWQGVVKSYQDSYHGWALGKSQIVANCQDCHTAHAIRSHLNPASSTSASHRVATCGRCHPKANPAFAQSYTHASFGQVLGYHDYVRYFYIGIIILTLGGMLLHNVIIYFYHLGEHRKEHLSEKYIVRMNRSEVYQHFLLLVVFIALAVTGLALRQQNSWWVRSLAWLGMGEATRALLHRIFAILLVAGTFWHTFWVLTTRRGRQKLHDYIPRPSDFKEFVQNVLFHLRLRPAPPSFETYDYTQKAEYWALVWGTIIMGLTGFILWFPTIATSWSPGWVVRVAGVIHYYEALLAVGAIIIWHFFFVIMHPKAYPVSLTFLTGRMPLHEWQHHHHRAAERLADQPELIQQADVPGSVPESKGKE